MKCVSDRVWKGQVTLRSRCDFVNHMFRLGRGGQSPVSTLVMKGPHMRSPPITHGGWGGDCPCGGQLKNGVVAYNFCVPFLVILIIGKYHVCNLSQQKVIQEGNNLRYKCQLMNSSDSKWCLETVLNHCHSNFYPT